jgi:TP901 family phage tail tape measure protein
LQALENVLSIKFMTQGVSGAITDLNTVGLRIEDMGRKAHGLDVIQTSLVRSGTALTVGGVALGGALVALAIKAGEAETGLTKVNLVAGLSATQTDRLREEVHRLALDPNVKEGPKKLYDGLYAIEQKGFDTTHSMEILRSAQIAATAGQADGAGVAEFLATKMHDYTEAGQAAATMTTDQLVTASLHGAGSLDNLAGSLGMVTNVAGEMHVEFAQVLAAIATMGERGVEAQSSSMGIMRLLIAFQKPTKELTAAAKQFGYESPAAAMKALGLAGAMNLVKEATGGSDEALLQIFGDLRTAKIALSLAGDASADFSAKLNLVRGSAGEAGKAATAMMNDPHTQFLKMLSDLATEGEALGREVLPDFIAALGKVREGIQWFEELDPSVKGFFMHTAEGAAVAALALGPLLIGAGKLLGLLKNIAQLQAAGGVAGLLKGLGKAGGGAAGGGAAGGGGSAAGNVATDIVGAVLGGRGGKTAATVEKAAVSAADDVLEAKLVKIADKLEGRSAKSSSKGMNASDVFSWAQDFANWKAGKGGVVKIAGTATGHAAEIEQEGAALAKVLRIGKTDVGSALKSLPGKLLSLLKGGSGVAEGAAMTEGAVAGAEGAAAGGGLLAGVGGMAGLGAAAMVAAPFVLTLGAAAVFAYKAWQVHNDKVAAEKSIKETADVQTEAASKGVNTFGSVAREKGFGEGDIAKLEDAVGDKKSPYYALAMQISKEAVGRNKTGHDVKVKQALYASNQATADANYAAIMQARGAVSMDGQLPSFAPSGAAGGPGAMVRGGSRITTTPNAKYGTMTQMTFYGSTAEQMKREAAAAIDRQFGLAPA